MYSYFIAVQDYIVQLCKTTRQLIWTNGTVISEQLLSLLIWTTKPAWVKPEAAVTPATYSADAIPLLKWYYQVSHMNFFFFVSTHNKRWACTGKWVSTAECQEEKGQLLVFFFLLFRGLQKELKKNTVKPSNIFCLLQFIQLFQFSKDAHPKLGIKLKLKRVPSCFWLPQQKLYPGGWMVVRWYGTQLTCQLSHNVLFV